MKKICILIALMLLIPSVALARDQYYKADPSWQTEIALTDWVYVSSIKKLNKKDVIIISKIHRLVEKKFQEHWGVNLNTCNLGPLQINIVKGDRELSNRAYFPNEDEYADLPGHGSEIIFGRYFRRANTMYVVPPNLSVYYWKSGFAHELLHYYFDECKMKFTNDGVEHRQIEKFLQKYRKIFN